MHGCVRSGEAEDVSIVVQRTRYGGPPVAAHFEDLAVAIGSPV